MKKNGILETSSEKKLWILWNTFDIIWILLVSIWLAMCSTHRTILVQALSSFWAIHNTWSSTNIILLAISMRASPIWKREEKPQNQRCTIRNVLSGKIMWTGKEYKWTIIQRQFFYSIKKIKWTKKKDHEKKRNQLQGKDVLFPISELIF